MSEGLPLKLTEKVLKELYFTITPNRDSFYLNKLRKDLKAAIQSSSTFDYKDFLALALVDFNLGNYDSAIQQISEMIPYNPEFIGIRAMVKLTLVHGNIPYIQSERSILEEYFNHSLTPKNQQLQFSVLLILIRSFSKKFHFNNQMFMNLSFVSPEEFTWEAGPFKGIEKFIPKEELNKQRDMGYYFDSKLQELILNNELKDEHVNFLKMFLKEEYVNEIILDYSSRDILEDRDYSNFEHIEL